MMTRDADSSQILTESLLALQRRLEQVRAQLKELDALRLEETRLVNAVKAIEAIVHPPASSDYAALMRMAESTIAPLDAARSETNKKIEYLIKRLTPMKNAVSSFTVEPPPKSLTDAAEKALRRAGRPMHADEIVYAVQAMGVHMDRDPKAVKASLVPAIHKFSTEGKRFVHLGEGMYALAGSDSTDQQKTDPRE